MKLIIIKDGERKFALSAEDIKLLNTDVNADTKEVKLGGEIIPVIRAMDVHGSMETNREKLLYGIRRLLIDGNKTDLEAFTKLLSDFTEIPESDSEPMGVTENFYGGLKEIMEAINDFKKTASAKIETNITEMAGDLLPETGDQLHAIVKATEKATTLILDITEKLQDSNSSLNTEMQKIKEMKNEFENGLSNMITTMEAMSKIKTRNDRYIKTILEALSFQDITGQQIYKIVEIVSKVDRNLKEIVLELGLKIKKKAKNTDPETLQKGESLLALLKGPKANMISQKEIDDIVSKFL